MLGKRHSAENSQRLLRDKERTELLVIQATVPD